MTVKISRADPVSDILSNLFSSVNLNSFDSNDPLIHIALESLTRYVYAEGELSKAVQSQYQSQSGSPTRQDGTASVVQGNFSQNPHSTGVRFMQIGLGNGQVATVAVPTNAVSSTVQASAASSLPMLSATTASGPSQTVRSDSVNKLLDDTGNDTKFSRIF